MPNLNTLMEYVRNFLNEYNAKTTTEISCIIFKHVIESISIVIRAFRKDGGHLLLIGPTGNGRRTVLKLAGLVSKFSIFEVTIQVPEFSIFEICSKQLKSANYNFRNKHITPESKNFQFLR